MGLASCASHKYSSFERIANQTASFRTNATNAEVAIKGSNFDIQRNFISSPSGTTGNLVLPTLKKKNLKLVVTAPDYEPQILILKRRVRPKALLKCLGLSYFTWGIPLLIDHFRSDFYQLHPNSQSVAINMNYSDAFYRRKLDELRGSDDPSIFVTYISNYPNSPFREDAIRLMDEVEYKLALEEGTQKAMERYISSHPNSHLLDEAKAEAAKVTAKRAKDEVEFILDLKERKESTPDPNIASQGDAHLLNQSKTAISPTYYFNIQKQIQPPNLKMVPSSLKFVDEDGNEALDAGEACAIQFFVTNESKPGFGDGYNLRALTSIAGSVSGITVAPVTQLPDVPLNSTTAFRIPLTADMTAKDGQVVVTIMVDEPNGFGMDSIQVEIETRAFRSPSLEVVDYKLCGEGKLRRKEPFTIELLIQNVGLGEAQDVSATLELPDNVFLLSDDQQVRIDAMAPGESLSLRFECIINNSFSEDEVAFGLNLTESYAEYARSWQHAFQFNDAMSTDRLVIQAQEEAVVDISRKSLSSDVDRDIPNWGTPLENRYALVIGNEDYASRSRSLNPEVNADFAENDARVVADYLRDVFGVPADHLTLMINATGNEMRREIKSLANLARAAAGNAEIYFYYSGHGLPSASDRTPYLIPVDGDGQQPELGVSLPDLYSQLTAHPVRRAHVILDACFSGGARNEELVAMKGIRVVPKANAIPDGLLVWASSSGNQASGVYREQFHGHFTYQLLKTLQEASEDAALGPLFDQVKYRVDIATALEGFMQTPEALCSPADVAAWPDWRIR